MRQPHHGERDEPDGAFRRGCGRAIAVICVMGGLIGAGYATSLEARGSLVITVVAALSVVTAGAGAVMWKLPWHRWPQRAPLCAVPPVLAIIAASNWVDPNPFLAAAFYFPVAMWVGAAQRRGTMLALSPLFAVAYWAPWALRSLDPGVMGSVLPVTAVCILGGEWLGWLTARLHSVQRRLREHDERRFQALLAASSDTTVVIGVQGEATYVSPAARRVLSVSADRLHGQRGEAFVAEHVHPADIGPLTAMMTNLTAEPASAETVRFRIKDHGTGWRDIEAVGHNLVDDTAVRGLLLNLRDVSERTNLERALTHQAFTDQLTNLPNRPLLRDRTEQALRVAGRLGHSTALLLIDLNRFKEVNDTLGHHHGDVLLQQIAERLQVPLRDGDTVARLGGDEFAVLLPTVRVGADASTVAQKLGAVFEAPFLVEDLPLNIDASIGLALYPDHAGDHNELLQQAEMAMYAAKAAHTPYMIYEPRLNHYSARRLRLLGSIRGAMEQDELLLHYQPKVDTSSGRVVGVEALVRWQHPEYGFLSPGDFIPLAEATGLIRPLTLHVLGLAVRQQKLWRDAGHDLSVAVNLSARCLLDPSLPAEVARLMDEYDVAPHCLVLELTESAIMTDPGRALEVVARLHELGVKLSIDDFGTGYSSMAYLKDLPVHELKIDRSFVATMCDNASERAIVRSTVDLGHSLGLRVVAEGVEDLQTWRDLEEIGCDQLQGYYISKPMPADQLVPWLRDQRFADRTPVGAAFAEALSSPGFDGELVSWFTGLR